MSAEAMNRSEELKIMRRVKLTVALQMQAIETKEPKTTDDMLRWVRLREYVLYLEAEITRWENEIEEEN